MALAREGAGIELSFFAFFRFFLTWWGAFILGALDSSPFFFVPFGTDAVVIYLCARNRSLFWLYPLLTAAGSVVGAAVAYALGVKIGDGFLLVFGTARVIRFGVEALLARRYGESVVNVLESDIARPVAIGMVIVSILGTILTIARVWRSTRQPRMASA